MLCFYNNLEGRVRPQVRQLHGRGTLGVAGQLGGGGAADVLVERGLHRADEPVVQKDCWVSKHMIDIIPKARATDADSDTRTHQM